MRTTGLLALGLLTAAPSFAQDEPAGGRHQIAPDNNWSINDADCMIDASWDGDIGIVVNRHIEHHDLGVYDPSFKNVAPEKVIAVRYGAAGKFVGRGEYQALGHRDGKSKSYAIEADDGLLDAFATTNSFQFWRAGTMDIELDMTGFAGALAAMRVCEASLAVEPAEMTMGDPNSTEAAMEAADAAAEAAVKP